MVYPSEPEFEQALHELTQSLQTFLKANPDYQRALDVVQIPERVIQFRVVWEDDKGIPHVNRGYRVQVRPFQSTATYNLLSLPSTILHWAHTKAASVCTPPSTSPSSNS